MLPFFSFILKISLPLEDSSPLRTGAFGTSKLEFIFLFLFSLVGVAVFLTLAEVPVTDLSFL